MLVHERKKGPVLTSLDWNQMAAGVKAVLGSIPASLSRGGVTAQ